MCAGVLSIAGVVAKFSCADENRCCECVHLIAGVCVDEYWCVWFLTGVVEVLRGG